MPAILAFLKLIPIRDYLWAAALVAVLGYHFYAVHEAGVTAAAHEVQALKDSSAKLVAANTAALAKKDADHTAAVSTITGVYNANLKTLSDQHDSDALRVRNADTDRRAAENMASAAAGRGDCSQYQEINGRLEASISSLEQMALGLRTAGSELNASLVEVSTERDSLVGK